jgi:drug/metabolite transporter (DMT)-like permease
MLGLLYIVLSSIFFGFSNAYWKKAIQNTPFLQVIFMRGLYTTSFFGLFYLLDLRWGIFEPWLGALPDFSVEQLGVSFGLCIFSAFGLFFFVRTLKTEAVSLVAPISSINVFGLLTAVLFFGDSWGLKQTSAILCVLVGLFFIFRSQWQFAKMSSFWMALGGSILASFFWGVSYSLFRFPIHWLGVLPFTFLLELSVTFFVGVLLVSQKHSWQAIPQRPIQVLALCIILGSIFLHISYQSASVTQIIFIGKSQLVLTLFFGHLLYREKLTYLQIVGVGFLILSIYLVV